MKKSKYRGPDGPRPLAGMVGEKIEQVSLAWARRPVVSAGARAVARDSPRDSGKELRDPTGGPGISLAVSIRCGGVWSWLCLSEALVWLSLGLAGVEKGDGVVCNSGVVLGGSDAVQDQCLVDYQPVLK